VQQHLRSCEEHLQALAAAETAGKMTKHRLQQQQVSSGGSSQPSPTAAAGGAGAEGDAAAAFGATWLERLQGSYLHQQARQLAAAAAAANNAAGQQQDDSSSARVGAHTAMQLPWWLADNLDALAQRAGGGSSGGSVSSSTGVVVLREPWGPVLQAPAVHRYAGGPGSWEGAAGTRAAADSNTASAPEQQQREWLEGARLWRHEAFSDWLNSYSPSSSGDEQQQQQADQAQRLAQLLALVGAPAGCQEQQQGQQDVRLRQLWACGRLLNARGDLAAADVAGKACLQMLLAAGDAAPLEAADAAAVVAQSANGHTAEEQGVVVVLPSCQLDSRIDAAAVRGLLDVMLLAMQLAAAQQQLRRLEVLLAEVQQLVTSASAGGAAAAANRNTQQQQQQLEEQRQPDEEQQEDASAAAAAAVDRALAEVSSIVDRLLEALGQRCLDTTGGWG
jgi:hypothetical protein